MFTNQICGLCAYMHAAECFRRRTRLCELVLKEGLSVTRAKDYSYLKATIGSTRIARRAGM
jgi:hypothetical protein